METGLTIVLPTRPQPDTIVAIYLLKAYGRERFPGIQDAGISVQPLLPKNTFEENLAAGLLPIDVGGGALDHHGTGLCASELVAKLLGIESDPTIKKMLAYAKRDDAEGKGTLSTDPLDRAFGLSGLIAALNKQYPKEPQNVVNATLPLLAAHHRGAREHHVELPEEVKRKKETHAYEEAHARQGDAKLKIAFIHSDKPSMPTYLRSWNGGAFDVVVQKTEEGNRVCVITRQERNVDLSMIAAFIRLREAEIRGIAIKDDRAYLSGHGKLVEIPFWYLDPATNSILNVGEAGTEDDTLIPFNEMKRIVVRGLEFVSKKQDA